MKLARLLEFFATIILLIGALITLPFRFILYVVSVLMGDFFESYDLYLRSTIDDIKDFAECLWMDIKDFFKGGTFWRILRFILFCILNTVVLLIIIAIVGVVFILAIMAVKHIWMSV